MKPAILIIEPKCSKITYSNRGTSIYVRFRVECGEYQKSFMRSAGTLDDDAAATQAMIWKTQEMNLAKRIGNGEAVAAVDDAIKVGKESLDTLVDEYAEWMRREGLSAHYVKYTPVNLRRVFAAMEPKPKQVRDLTAERMEAALTEMEAECEWETGRTWESFRVMLVSFLNWMIRPTPKGGGKGLVANAALGIRTKNGDPVHERRPLSQPEFQFFIETILNYPLPNERSLDTVGIAAAMIIANCTGWRSKAVRALMASDVQIEEGCLWLNTPKGWAGKTTPRQPVTDPVAIDIITRHIAATAHLGARLFPVDTGYMSDKVETYLAHARHRYCNPHLFTDPRTVTESRPDGRTFPKLADDVAKARAASDFCKYIDSREHKSDFHALRTKFGCDLIKAGAGILEVCERMGHRNIETTRKFYLKWGEEDAKKAVARLPKLARIA